MPILASRAAGAIRAFGMTVSSGAASIARDLYFRFNSLLLKGNTGDVLDSPKQLPPAFNTDYSSNNLPLAITGNSRPTKFNPYSGNYYSTYFSGSNYVDYALGSTGAAAFGTGDFTIEFWVYPTAAPNNNWSPFLTIGNSGGGQEIRISQNINGTGWGWLYPNNANSADTYTGYGTLPINRWHHIAVVRSGSNMYLFLNGTVTATNTGVSFNFTSTTVFRTGYPQPAYPDGSYVGYMHGLRIVKGVAVYTAAFTSPSTVATTISGTSFLGHQTPYFKDISSNNLVPTATSNPTISQFTPLTQPSTYEFYGAGVYDGSSYLSTPYNSQFDFGTGDFTVEWWWYLNTAFTGIEGPGIGQKASDAGNGWIIYRNHSINTDKITIRLSSANNDYSATVVPAVGQWQHWAVSRSGTTLQWYCNGVACGTYTGVTGNASAGSGAPMYIGFAQTWSYTTGSSYISDIRVTKGTALYTGTSTLTLPTSPVAGTSSALSSLKYNGSLNNNMIVDKSNINAVVTRTGNVTQGTFSPYHNSWSIYFNGSTDYLTIPQTFSLPTTTTPFTIEAWIYINAYTGSYIGSTNWASGGAIPFVLGVSNGSVTGDDLGGRPFLNFYNGSSWAAGVISATAIPLATWTHVAGVFDGTTAAIYTDGVRNNTWTTTWTTSSQVNYHIGKRWDSGANVYFNGYISNFRLTIGTAIYSGASFAAPVKGLSSTKDTAILVASSGTITDNSKYNYAITVNGTPKPSMLSPFSPSTITQNQGYYSTYFPSASWLLTPAIAQTNIGTQDFTVELWFYMTNTASYGTMFNLGQYTNGIMLRIDTQTYSMYVLGSQVVGTGTAPLNTWVHLALVRKTNSIYLWANGVQVGSTTTNSGAISPTAAIKIGSSAHTSGEHFFGYLTNIRLVVGNGLYTSAFTPPTTPLTAIAGTQFLGLQNTTQVDNSPNQMQVYVNGGTPKIVPFSPFTAPATTVTLGTLMSPYQISGSIYFDGAGDYLAIPDAPIYNLSSGAWTIECYVFLTGGSSYRTFISKRSSTNAQWELGINPSNFLYFYTSTVYVSATDALANNRWYHCVASYDGTNTRLFVNGVLVLTQAVTAATGTDPVYVGSIYGGSQPTVGYIAGLRVIKGKALYAAAFIPPTEPPTPTPETILLIKGDNPGIYDSTGGNNLETIGSAKVSTAIKKFNSGSLQFNGSTDYLMIPGNPIFNLGTSDWTVEAWVYLNALPTSDAWPTNFSQHMVLIGEGTASQGDGFCCIIGQTKLLVQNNDTQFASPGTHNMSANTWYHLAFVRSSGSIIFYVNGASTGSVAFSASLGTGANTYIGCETAQGAFLNGYIDDLRFSRIARYTGPYFPLPTTSAQESGPSETEPGTSGVTYVAGDGLSAATAGLSAAAIKAQTGTNADGAYWINLPTVGPTQVYCIMNSAVSGGGWMMAMKATRGTTFSYSSTHWNTATTLNPTATNRADGDAKFNTMNYFAGNDMLAVFPDITTNGGSLGTNALNCWTWLETNFNGGTATTMINFFNTAGTYNTGNVNTAGNYGGKFIKDAKTFSGWASGIFSSQPDIRFYGFNYKNGGLSYGGNGNVRWGFGWNENGEGLYSSPSTLASGAATGSNDVWGGIGNESGGGSYSAGDVVSCCQDTTGINRSARVEIYIR